MTLVQAVANNGKFHIDCALQQLEEMEASFDLRWKADMRAIKMWQEGHPERQMTWPDHADLCVWLLDRIDDSDRALDHVIKLKKLGQDNA